jgi:hypothetical protein
MISNVKPYNIIGKVGSRWGGGGLKKSNAKYRHWLRINMLSKIHTYSL